MNQTLSVTLRPSRALAMALTVIAAAALACAWISLPALALPLVVAGIVLTWAWQLALALHRRDAAIHTLELNAAGGARYQDGLGQWREAGILPGCYVSRWLIVVALGAGGRRRHCLVLLPDSASEEQLRQLRVWLRWRRARP